MANPSWEASQREQLLQNQLLQDHQQFEAWKARQAQPQKQVVQGQAPPLVPLEPTVIVKPRLITMLKLFQWGQPVLKGLLLEARHRLMFLNVPGLVRQHLADPSLPAGTTLEGLTLPRNHPRPVLDVLMTDLCMRRTLRFLRLTWPPCW